MEWSLRKMSLNINPLQPFQVRHQSTLTPLQTQSLTQLYQPIIGPLAISLYFTLLNQPLEAVQKSQRLLHAQLLQNLNVGIQVCDEARRKLEAVGLLRTYREIASHTEWQYQTLLYDVQLPLDTRQFLNHPMLSTALFNQIGDQSYYQLLKYWEIEALDDDQYSEITTPFQQMFYYVPREADQEVAQATENRNFKHQTAQSNLDMLNENFEYGRFLRYLMSEGIEHTQLTQSLKEHVMSVSQVYQLDEMQMTQVVLLAVNDVTDQIQLDKIKEIAQKKQFFQQKRQPEAVSQLNETSTEPPQRTFPFNYTEQELKERQVQLRKEFTGLSSEDIDLVCLCEQIPLADFLMKTKQAKGGFATDSEQFFVKDLAQKTTLPSQVINFLVYYLLIMERKDNVFKSDLQRVANEWQQQKIESPGAAIIYIHNKAKEPASQPAAKRPYTNYGRKSKREVPIPDWMQKQNSSGPVTAATSGPEPTKELTDNEQAIRAKLDKLFGEDVKNHAIDATTNE